MKNVFPIMLGVLGLMATGLTYAIYRKDKEIEESFSGKTTSSVGSNTTNQRVADVHVTAMAGPNSSGGITAIESIRPRGVAVMTTSGHDSSNSTIFDNKRPATFNRREEWDTRIAEGGVVKRNVLIANGSRGIANRGRILLGSAN